MNCHVAEMCFDKSLFLKINETLFSLLSATQFKMRFNGIGGIGVRGKRCCVLKNCEVGLCEGYQQKLSYLF